MVVAGVATYHAHYVRPTKTKLPDGRPYGYDVGAAECPTQVDIVAEWMKQLRAVGVGPGLYYSLKDNFYLNSEGGGKSNTRTLEKTLLSCLLRPPTLCTKFMHP